MCVVASVRILCILSCFRLIVDIDLVFFFFKQKTVYEVRISDWSSDVCPSDLNFESMAIPYFILAGGFLTHGGVARRMINFATSIVGHLHGGLGLAGVLACALFAAIAGSSPATVMAIGSIILPAMVRQGFPNRFGAGIITTSGSLGILIPPSIVMVLYSVSTNTSVGDLFIAGVVPGILLALLLGFVTWFIARRNNYSRFREFEQHGTGAATAHALWGLQIGRAHV